jgi:hypothetical protein
MMFVLFVVVVLGAWLLSRLGERRHPGRLARETIGDARLGLVLALAMTAVWIPIVFVEPFSSTARAGIVAVYAIVDVVFVARCRNRNIGGPAAH